jgi:hypothetical protein
VSAKQGFTWTRCGSSVRRVSMRCRWACTSTSAATAASLSLERARDTQGSSSAGSRSGTRQGEGGWEEERQDQGLHWAKGSFCLVACGGPWYCTCGEWAHDGGQEGEDVRGRQAALVLQQHHRQEPAPPRHQTPLLIQTGPAVAKRGRGGHVSPHRAASVTTSCMAGLVLASRRPT